MWYAYMGSSMFPPLKTNRSLPCVKFRPITAITSYLLQGNTVGKNISHSISLLSELFKKIWQLQSKTICQIKSK